MTTWGWVTVAGGVLMAGGFAFHLAFEPKEISGKSTPWPVSAKIAGVGLPVLISGFAGTALPG